MTPQHESYYGEELKTKNRNTLIWILVTIVLGLSFLGLGLFLGTKGYLRSNNNQSVELKPLYNTSTFNYYDFEPNTENNYDFNPNHTIIVNIPSDLCGT